MSNDIDTLFNNFAEEMGKGSKQEKSSKGITARYRGCGRSSKARTGAASDVTHYIYEDGVCVGQEIIKVRKRK